MVDVSGSVPARRTWYEAQLSGEKVPAWPYICFLGNHISENFGGEGVGGFIVGVGAKGGGNGWVDHGRSPQIWFVRSFVRERKAGWAGWQAQKVWFACADAILGPALFSSNLSLAWAPSVPNSLIKPPCVCLAAGVACGVCLP